MSGCCCNSSSSVGPRGPQGPPGPRGLSGSLSNSTLVFQDPATQGSEVSGGAFVVHPATEWTMPAGSLVSQGDMLRYSVFFFAGDTGNPTVSATFDRYLQIRMDGNPLFSGGYPDAPSFHTITVVSGTQRVNCIYELMRVTNTEVHLKADLFYYSKTNQFIGSETFYNYAINISGLGKTLDASSLDLAAYVKQDSDLAKNRLYLLDVRVEKYNL